MVGCGVPAAPPPANDSAADRQDRPDPAVAARLKAATAALLGSQLAAARTCGLDRTAVNKMLAGARPPAVALLAGLAARGADVTALLTGEGPTLAAVPRFARLLPGLPAAGRDEPVGLAAAPTGLIAPGTYAVTFDTDIAAATLGGDPADRPRVGDTIVVVTDVATALAVAGAPAGKVVTLPPPVVLMGGIPRLSLVHRVRLTAAGITPAVRGPLRAEPVADVSDLPPDAAGSLPSVAFAAWQAGPVGTV